MKKVIVTGEVGSYLEELLLNKECEVYGIIRRSSSVHTGRIDHLHKDPHDQPRLKLLYDAFYLHCRVCMNMLELLRWETTERSSIRPPAGRRG